MNLSEHIHNHHLSVIAKPNASKTEVLGYDEARAAVRIAVAAAPDDGKANKELLKFLKKELKKERGEEVDVVLKSGTTARLKLFFIP